MGTRRGGACANMMVPKGVARASQIPPAQARPGSQGPAPGQAQQPWLPSESPKTYRTQLGLDRALLSHQLAGQQGHTLLRMHLRQALC